MVKDNQGAPGDDDSTVVVRGMLKSPANLAAETWFSRNAETRDK
jgi:hypothetical protein